MRIYNLNMRVLLSSMTVMLLILGAGMFAWNSASKTNHMLCYKDCGEGFIAQHQVQNFKLYGFKHLLLEDHATSMDESQHTFFYTHNLNIGGIAYQVLESVGVASLKAKQAITLLVFSLGLLYIYRAIKFITGSLLLSAVTLAFAITDVNQVLAFSLNALRAWHWLAIFGLLYHVAKYIKSNDKSVINKISILLFMFVSFGIGYEFFAICIVMSLMTVVAMKNESDTLRSQGRKLAVIISLALVPFLLRQLQVAYVLGFQYWSMDFYYSFIIKIPFISKVFPINFDEINSFYSSHNILRPHALASGHSSFASHLDLFSRLMKSIVIPETGLLSVILFCMVSSIAILNASYQKSIYFIRGRAVGVKQKHDSNVSAAATLLIFLSISFFIGMLFFLPFSFHVYLKHQFPLIAIPFHIAKAIVITYMVVLFVRYRNVLVRSLLVTVISLICIDHCIVHMIETKQSFNMSTAWIQDIQKNPDATYAVSWIPSTVAGFSNNWVVGIKPGSENEIAARYQTNKQLFTTDDLFLFGQRGKDDMAPYLQPDYWLYFPVEKLNPYDSFSNSKKEDYILRFINSFSSKENVKLKSTWISETRVAPGSIINFGGNLSFKRSDIVGMEILEPVIIDDPEQLEIAMESINYTAPISKININLTNSTFYGEFNIPDSYKQYVSNGKDITCVLPVGIVFANGDKQIMHAYRVVIDQNLNAIKTLRFRPNQSQPDAMALTTMLSGLPVKSTGDGYVIFDLRDTKY